MEKLLALEQYLQSPEFTEGSAVRLIMSDIYKSNQFLQIGTVIANVQKFQDNYGSLALLSIVLLGSLSTVAIYKFKKSKIALVLGELSAVFMVGIIYYIPFKGVRFIAGLHFFACFLSIHSRICAILQTKQGTESQSETGKSESPASNKDVPKSWVRDTLGFAAEAFMTFFYNLLPKLGNLGHSKFPSIGRLLYWFSLSILTDLALYGMKEWIPANMHAQNQYFAISVVGGIWVLLSMDWAYCNFIIVFDIMGHPVPTELRHRHPLLSTSLSEFWGYRWNPVIGKLLQDSFYKPLRRVGVPRIVCILACFTGETRCPISYQLKY